MLFLLAVTMEEATHKARDAHTGCEGLILRMAAGDKDALRALYAQTSTAVYGFALSITKKSQDAEDVMQDAYVTMWAKAGSYTAMGKPMAWVLTLVRNLALMRLRATAKAQPLPETGGPAQDGPETASLDRLVLRAALDILADDERQVVTLHSVAGLRHREIAALLQMPLGTVLSKYRRALAKLQKYLKEER